MFVWFSEAITLASRSIHFPHAAFADKGGNVVMAETGADFERHGLSG